MADLASDRMLWTPSILTDYLFFSAQTHSVLGIVLRHPLHPYTSLERFWVLVLQILLTACVTLVQVHARAHACLHSSSVDNGVALRCNTSIFRRAGE